MSQITPKISVDTLSKDTSIANSATGSTPTSIKTKPAPSKPRPLDCDPSVYLRNDYVVIDFETTNKDHGSPANPGNQLVLACWLEAGGNQRDERRVQSCFGGEYEQQRLGEAVRRASFVVAYNAKFELGWLRRCGLELRDLIVYDPMLGEYVLGGNVKPDGGLSLDASLGRYGIPGKMQYVSALIEAGVCPSDIPPRELEEYCKCDVRRTHELFLRQRQRIHRADLQRVLYGRCLQSPMLADIEWRGVQLDEQGVEAKSKLILQEYHTAEQGLEAFCGAVNWRSPKQVRELVYGKLGFDELRDHRGEPIRTGKGDNPSTAEETIGRLVSSTPDQRAFKRLYGTLAPLKKAVSTLESMRGACDEDAGLIFAAFNQAVTQNHRLSSTGGKWGFNFQNFARDFKGLFRARRPGWKVVEGDCPQLEFRVGIELSGDRTGLADVLARRDVHALTASVTGLSRQEAKPHTFKPMYGGRSGTPRMVKYYEAFRQRYSELYKAQMGWVYTVLAQRQLQIASGLVFYWPDTVRKGDYVTNTPSIFNYPISSFATADISQLSLLLFWHSLRGMDSFIVNTVHDSGVYECPEEELDKTKGLMIQSYTEDIYEVLTKLYGHTFNCPLGLGLKAGDVWGQGREEKSETTRFKFTSDAVGS